jgi:hypothetical protein
MKIMMRKYWLINDGKKNLEDLLIHSSCLGLIQVNVLLLLLIFRELFLVN